MSNNEITSLLDTLESLEEIKKFYVDQENELRKEINSLFKKDKSVDLKFFDLNKVKIMGKQKDLDKLQALVHETQKKIDYLESVMYNDFCDVSYKDKEKKKLKNRLK